MSRRQFLRVVAGAGGLLGACRTTGAQPPVGGRAEIRAICFDLFTLFDPRGVERAAEAVAPGQAAELCRDWRVRQFEYAWLRATADQYRDFEFVTGEALDYAAGARGLSLSAAERRRLVAAYSELTPWPDTRAALDAWRRVGLRLAPLANYSPAMLDRLLTHAGLADLFDDQISTDRARTYKPSPRAYALGPTALGVPREQIVFAAFGGWDAAGAAWYGFPTFWLNRLQVAPEALSAAAHATGATLADLAAFVAA
ncbi:haloacid dehalogenase type II [Nannocystis bainbridge]|uniref:Haloacid dehalogenase type II n=1 Tax=Nannocystis bainbridge TaxID=2995303 RepID=A0ABT5DT18_9BACT|nr:haloacid dehalogenase type II [Nannocystis bainbridge]MDC0716676.1 haloacid dehalogenase type II [Nannocystis bainbridge]